MMCKNQGSISILDLPTRFEDTHIRTSLKAFIRQAYKWIICLKIYMLLTSFHGDYPPPTILPPTLKKFFRQSFEQNNNIF